MLFEMVGNDKIDDFDDDNCGDATASHHSEITGETGPLCRELLTINRLD